MTHLPLFLFERPDLSQHLKTLFSWLRVHTRHPASLLHAAQHSAVVPVLQADSWVIIGIVIGKRVDGWHWSLCSQIKMDRHTHIGTLNGCES